MAVVCSTSGIPEPSIPNDTPTPYCAVEDSSNNTAILHSCCSPSGSNFTTSTNGCYSYCFTPEHQFDHVSLCVNANVTDGSEFFCGILTVSGSSSSSVTTGPTSTVPSSTSGGAGTKGSAATATQSTHSNQASSRKKVGSSQLGIVLLAVAAVFFTF